ncbi:hypothetical protein ONZ51_g455 [Trametes cubensis]|uniref:RING-type domain-containing protein n=1 Tax=Trametes cubensis TaxID=1111947 RepID=A0AAD7U5R1_9APHY|nr:hypothetical protein ONZ51_g455 [Trametes cubensis]
MSNRHPHCEHCNKGFKNKRGWRSHGKICTSAAAVIPMPAGGVSQKMAFSQVSHKPSATVPEHGTSVITLEQPGPQTVEPNKQAQAGPAAPQIEWFFSGSPMLSMANALWAPEASTTRQVPDSTSENAEGPGLPQALKTHRDNPTEDQVDSSTQAACADEHIQSAATTVTAESETDAEKAPVIEEKAQCLDTPVNEDEQDNVEPILSIMNDQEGSGVLEMNHNGEHQHGSDDAGEQTAERNPSSEPPPPPHTAEDLLKSLITDLTKLRTPPLAPPPRTAEELLKSVMSRGPQDTRLTLRQPPLPSFPSLSADTSSSEGAIWPTSTRASISACLQESMRTDHNEQSSETVERRPMLAERKGRTKPPVQDEFIPAEVLLQPTESASARVAEWLYDQAQRRSGCGWTINVQPPAHASSTTLPPAEPVAGIKGKRKVVTKPTAKAEAPVNVNIPPSAAEDPPSSTAATGTGCQTVVDNAEPPPRPVRTKTSKDASPAAPTLSRISWHCRVCLMQPCVEPVVTFCGHIFCHRCIVEELDAKGACPVCEKLVYTRLNV